jgi:hypothetical protein
MKFSLRARCRSNQSIGYKRSFPNITISKDDGHDFFCLCHLFCDSRTKSFCVRLPDSKYKLRSIRYLLYSDRSAIRCPACSRRLAEYRPSQRAIRVAARSLGATLRLPVRLDELCGKSGRIRLHYARRRGSFHLHQHNPPPPKTLVFGCCFYNDNNEWGFAYNGIAEQVQCVPIPIIQPLLARRPPVRENPAPRIPQRGTRMLGTTTRTIGGDDGAPTVHITYDRWGNIVAMSPGPPKLELRPDRMANG